MKKSLLSVLTLIFILILAINTCFATPSPEPTQSAANTQTSLLTPPTTREPTGSPENTQSAGANNTNSATLEPSKTPSTVPPMDFKVFYNNERKIVLNKNNDDVSIKLQFVFNAREDFFSENFTLLTITNEATKDVYTVNKELFVNDSGYFFESDVFIPSTKVGTNVEFTLDWMDFSGALRKTSAEIEVVEPKPELSIEAVVESTSAVPGSLIQVKYFIKNTGNVPVKNILIKDSAVTDLNGLDAFTTDDYLSVNGTIIKYITIVLDGEINLSPIITYTYEGEGYENSGESVKIVSEDITPSISLTCDSYVALNKGDNHTFNYQIINTTSLKLLNVRVYNSDSADAILVKEIPSIDIGQDYSGTYTAPISKSGFYKFKIVYTYENADGDKEISAKTDKPIKLPNEIFLHISKVEPQEITGPGKVQFTLEIENGTNYELRDIVITEETNLFEKLSFDNIIVPAMKNGEPGKYTFTVDVDIYNDATAVLFNLGYTINNEHTTINTSHTVNFVNATQTPAESATPTPTPNATNNSPDKRFILIIILSVLFLFIVLALIIILAILKNKNNNDPDDDYDDDYNDNEEVDYDEDFDIEIAEDANEENVENEVVLDESEIEIIDDDIDDEGVKIYKKK